jgi:hypothetical protein
LRSRAWARARAARCRAVGSRANCQSTPLRRGSDWRAHACTRPNRFRVVVEPRPWMRGPSSRSTPKKEQAVNESAFIAEADHDVATAPTRELDEPFAPRSEDPPPEQSQRRVIHARPRARRAPTVSTADADW